MKRIFALLLISVTIFSLLGCSSDDETSASPVKAIQVNGGSHEANIVVGSNYTLPTKGKAIKENGKQEEITIKWDQEVVTTTPNQTTYFGRANDLKTDLTIEFTVTVHPESGTEIGLDNPIPAAPQGIKAEQIEGEDGIRLSWDDTAAEYIIYRGDKYSLLFEEAITTNQYIDYTVTPGAEYTYYLQAIGGSGLNSELSAPITQVASGYNGIKIHYKYQEEGRPWLYAWVPEGEADINGTWPGKAMKEESNNWYLTELPGYSNIGLKFTKEDTTSITGDLMRSKGEWWYKDGNWYYTNPEE